MKYCWTITMVLTLASTLVWLKPKTSAMSLFTTSCAVISSHRKAARFGSALFRKVEFKLSGNQLEVVRLIGKHRVKGIGRIETATPDKIKVLRVHFRSKDKDYEATYLIGSDLDNHGRLTGYVYLKGGGTKAPGLEALFIEQKGVEGIPRR